MDKLVLSWDDVLKRVEDISRTLPNTLYGIPRGGSIVAGLIYQQRLQSHRPCFIVQHPQVAQIAIDDIIDSGETAKHYLEEYSLRTVALVDKQAEDLIGTWIEFPWEKSEGPPRFIRESPIATWDGRYEIEYQDIKCPFDHQAPTLVIYSVRVDKRGHPYYLCSECLGLIYTISPENPVIWKPSRTSTNLATRRKTVKVNLDTLAKSNPQIARAMEASDLELKKLRGEKLTVREYLIWREFNGKK